MLLEQVADPPAIVAEQLLEHRHEDAQCVVAHDGTARQGRNVPGFRCRDRESVGTVHVQHDMDIGTSVAHVNHTLARHTEPLAQRVDRGHLAEPRRHADDRRDLARHLIVPILRADDAFGRDDALERRVDDVFRSGRDDVEVEAVSVNAIGEQVRQQRDIPLEADTATDFDEIFTTNAAKLRIVKQQVRQLGAGLNEIQL